ncbi:MAG: hypothetical protein H6825_06475 [Planctomycetes bacterium]|nr:hypothetical protein [Planctomycetota bacterium]
MSLPPGTLLVVPTALEARGLGRPDAARCGVGLVASALGAAELLARRRPTALLLVGLAGTRDVRRLPVGTLLAVDSVLNAAVGAGAGAGFVPLGALGLPADEDLPPDRLELLHLEGPWPAGSAQHHGVSATVATASSDRAQAATLPCEALIEEMEGYAVALACRRAGVACAMLRAVSNEAGVRDKAAWDVAGALAALAAALDALEVP